MRLMFCSVVVLGSVACFLRAAMAQEAPMDVVPQPQQITRLDGEWTVTARTMIVVGEEATADERFAAAQLSSEIRAAGGPQPAIAATNAVGGGPTIRLAIPARDGLSLAMPREIGDQGYVLEARDGALTLAANTSAGLFYAVQTACQLLRKTAAGVGLPAVHIVDWPDTKHRMIQYDFARGQQANVTYVKRMIDVLSRFKLNELMFFMEDDYKFARYPFLGRPGTWTRPMIEELVAYARPRHVQLVPQIESLGHGNSLLQHPELADLRENVAEYTGPKPFTTYCSGFCPTAPGIEKFWDAIYGELAEVFSNSDFIHVGLDESHQFGFCNRCQAFEKAHGKAALFVQYVDMLNRNVRTHGKTMMYWEPWGGLAVPRLGDWIKQHPQADFLDQAIGFDYEYTNWSKWRIGLLQKAGLKRLYVSPGVVDWGDIYPDYGIATKNISAFILAGLKAGAEGVCTTTWSLTTGAFFEQTWYGHVYTAQCAWSSKQTDLDVFDYNFASSFFGLTGEDRGQVVSKLVRDYTKRPFREEFWGTAGENGATVGFCTKLFWSSLCDLTAPYRPQYFVGKTRDFPDTKEAERLVQLTDDILRTIDRIRPSVKRNQMTLDFMELAARSYRHVARKIIVRERCGGLYREAEHLAATDRAAARERLRRVVAELDALKADYRYFTAMYTRGMNECGSAANCVAPLKSVESLLDRQIATIRNVEKTLAKQSTTRMPPALAVGLGAAGPFNKIGQWTPQTTPHGVGQLRFDATPLIDKAGKYYVRLLFQTGKHGITTCAVALLADGKEVAHDTHQGWTPGPQFYTLDVPQAASMKKWTLMVTVDGSKGTDSTGDIAVLYEAK